MINIDELKMLEKERNKFKIEAYEYILTQISNKVKEYSYVLNQKYCIYQVPEFIFGYSVYNIDECCEWIIKELNKKGLTEVHKIETNILVIKWT